tara:strand:+ start:526 stop:1005 length:480 start_codon:yes stop_codon:yes gene_type:complete
MLGSIGYFEAHRDNVWSGRPTDVQQWRETTKALGGDTLILINESDYTPRVNDSTVTFELHATLSDVTAAHPTVHFVFLEELSVLDAAGVSSTNMRQFTHPTGDVLYVTGRDSGGGLDIAAIEAMGHPGGVSYVCLTATASLWALVTQAIILSDRMTKAA